MTMPTLPFVDAGARTRRRETQTQTAAPDPEAIRAYFSEAQDDYFTWSRGHNMHFGYYAPGMNPFDREAMLERMNEEAIHLLRLDPDAEAVVAPLPSPMPKCSGWRRATTPIVPRVD